MCGGGGGGIVAYIIEIEIVRKVLMKKRWKVT